MPKADPVEAIKSALRLDGLATYEPSPGQIPDHVHYRVAKLALGALDAGGFIVFHPGDPRVVRVVQQGPDRERYEEWRIRR